MSERTPTRGEVLARSFELFSAGLYVCRPGQIQSIDNDSLLLSVKPLLKEMTEDASGDTVIEPLPIVNGCVLYFPQGGDFVDTFPVKVGDPCWLIFPDRGLDRWQAGNGDTDPVFANRHDLGMGALVLVGGRPKAAAIQEFDTARRVIGKQGGVRIAISDSLIHLGVAHGEDAAHFVALDNLVKQEIQRLQQAFNNAVDLIKGHVHPTGTPGDPTSASVELATGLQPAPEVQDVAAENVKAK